MMGFMTGNQPSEFEGQYTQMRSRQSEVYFRVKNFGGQYILFLPPIRQAIFCIKYIDPGIAWVKNAAIPCFLSQINDANQYQNSAIGT